MKRRSESEEEELRRSAHRLVMAVLTANDLHPDHKNEFIRLALFKVTAATGKYTTGFISKDAFNIRERDPSCKDLRHEHVIPRLTALRELLRLQKIGDKDIETKTQNMMGLCSACVVTREEHSLLNPNEFGWFRYLNASRAITICRDDGSPLETGELRTLAENQLTEWRALDFDCSPAKRSKGFM